VSVSDSCYFLHVEAYTTPYLSCNWKEREIDTESASEFRRAEQCHKLHAKKSAHRAIALTNNSLCDYTCSNLRKESSLRGENILIENYFNFRFTKRRTTRRDIDRKIYAYRKGSELFA
jgi:hypothetical protein